MTNNELDTIAHELITGKTARGEIVRVAWAVQELINGQGAIAGDGTEFYCLCAREHVHRVVKRVVEQVGGTEEGDPKQMKLEGFDHLKVAYTVEREGERVLVPIDRLSAAELMARAEEYDKLAEGCKAHAREIRRYLANRTDVSANAGGK